MLKSIIKSKYLMFLLIFLLLLLPATINMPSQTDLRTIVIGVGIDKQNDQYEVSTEIITPQGSVGLKGNVQVFCARAENVLDAIQKLSIQLGKISGLGNASVVIFGDEISKEGIAGSLDFFLRSKRLNDNATVVTTNGTAKDLLMATSQVDKSYSFSINNLSKFNKQSLISESVTLEEFLSDYYNKTPATLVSQIEITKDDASGISTKGQSGKTGSESSGMDAGSSGGSNSSGNGDNTPSEFVSNRGTTAVFKDGKKIMVLNSEEIKGFTTLTDAQRGVLVLNNISDGSMQNADVELSIKQKFMQNKYKFSKNGVPQVYYNLNYIIKVEHVIQDNKNDLIIDSSNSFITKALEQKFREKLTGYIADSINLLKKYDIDLFKSQLMFERYKPKEWKNFLKTLSTNEVALDKIEYFVDINVSGVI